MPYADYNGFDITYFKGKVETDPHPVGYWYYPDEVLEYDRCASQLANVTGNEKILAVGCGYGYMIRYFIDEYDFDRVYGIEVSEWVQRAAFDDVTDRQICHSA